MFLAKSFNNILILWIRRIIVKLIKNLKIHLNLTKYTFKSNYRKTGGAENACILLLCSIFVLDFDGYYSKSSRSDPSKSRSKSYLFLCILLDIMEFQSSNKIIIHNLFQNVKLALFYLTNPIKTKLNIYMS